jgi:hypothetical protein
VENRRASHPASVTMAGMSLNRIVTPTVVAATVAAAALVAALALLVPTWREPAATQPGPADGSSPSLGVAHRVEAGRVEGRVEAVRAARVLRRWDERRAAAYAEGDAERLRGLYAPGSSAGGADLRLLRSYTDRGLLVTGLRVQLVDLEVLRRTGARLVMRVQDRVAGGGVVAVGEWQERAQLPRDRPTTRTVTLVREREREQGRWLVRSVRVDRVS